MVRRILTVASNVACAPDEPLEGAVQVCCRQIRIGPVGRLERQELAYQIATCRALKNSRMLGQYVVVTCPVFGKSALDMGGDRELSTYPSESIMLDPKLHNWRLTRQREIERRGSDRKMHLCIVGIRQFLMKLIPVGLMFVHVMTRMGNNFLVKPFHQIKGLGMKASLRQIPDLHVSGDGCRELRDELRSIAGQ